MYINAKQGAEIQEDFKQTDLGVVHRGAMSVHEHGHWWMSCPTCGAQWDAIELHGGGYDYERVSEGDGHCEEHALES